MSEIVSNSRLVFPPVPGVLDYSCLYLKYLDVCKSNGIRSGVVSGGIDSSYTAVSVGQTVEAWSGYVLAGLLGFAEGVRTVDVSIGSEAQGSLGGRCGDSHIEERTIRVSFNSDDLVVSSVEKDTGSDAKPGLDVDVRPRVGNSLESSVSVGKNHLRNLKNRENRKLARVNKGKLQHKLEESIYERRTVENCAVSGVTQARLEREKYQSEISRVFLEKQKLALASDKARFEIEQMNSEANAVKARLHKLRAEQQLSLWDSSSEALDLKRAEMKAKTGMSIVRYDNMKARQEKMAEIKRKENWRDGASGVPEQQVCVSSSGGSISVNSSASQAHVSSSISSRYSELEQEIEEQRSKLVSLENYNKSVRAMCSQNYDETLVARRERDLAYKERDEIKVSLDKLSAVSKDRAADARRMLEMRKQVESVLNENARLVAELSLGG